MHRNGAILATGERRCCRKVIGRVDAPFKDDGGRKAAWVNNGVEDCGGAGDTGGWFGAGLRRFGKRRGSDGIGAGRQTSNTEGDGQQQARVRRNVGDRFTEIAP
ncbi:MAG: hypothetical protein HC876_16845 [Chloroflexaceae bacterium]|nr:hypothetical protein [Chloroflexaceae bacterium]